MKTSMKVGNRGLPKVGTGSGAPMFQPPWGDQPEGSERVSEMPRGELVKAAYRGRSGKGHTGRET